MLDHRSCPLSGVCLRRQRISGFERGAIELGKHCVVVARNRCETPDAERVEMDSRTSLPIDILERIGEPQRQRAGEPGAQMSGGIGADPVSPITLNEAAIGSCRSNSHHQ